MIAMVNHQAGHAAVNADIIPRDKARFFGADLVCKYNYFCAIILSPQCLIALFHGFL